MSTYLDVRTAIVTVEQALVAVLDLGLSRRHPAVADVAALKAVASVGTGDVIPPDTLRYVTSEGVVYRWRKFSTSAENLPAVVRPSDREGATYGRWERQSSTVTYGPAYFRPLHRVATGYAKRVQLWQGIEGTEAAMEDLFAQSPALLIRWLGDELTMKANHPRGLNEVNMPFEVWCFSRNLRDERQALEGSAITSENDADPGLFRIMGDVRYLLAGSDLGIPGGVRYVDIQGGLAINDEKWKERGFFGVVPLTVMASYNIPDEDLVPISEVWIQGRDASTQTDDAFDTDNYLLEGYRLNYGTGTGLAVAPTPGTAYINGDPVQSQPGAHTFTASMQTYRDLRTDGVLIYKEVAINADPPDQDANTLRIGVTTTDASDVVHDAILCHYLNDHGEPFRAYPPRGE